jgi:membrane protease YdiL (CAAX protease family)
MKRYSTIFLKIAVILIAVPVLALCIFGGYWLANNPASPNYAYVLYPILIGMYVSAIPFFFALHQALKLLNFIDKNKAFSQVSVKALKSIKYCAITISTLYVILMPFVYVVAEKDDAPGLIIVGMVPVFAAMVIAVFAAVLQKLLQEAIDIKSENDLTV